MGDRNKKQRYLRASILENIENWSFEPTEWEAWTIKTIENLPIIRVRRYPIEKLLYMRMPAQQCHANAKFMENADPDRATKHITGWWIQGDTYVLHSVILRNDQYFCVTPAPAEANDFFDFIPDEKIVWREDGKVHSAYRDGVRIGMGLRKDPATHLNNMQVLKRRLLDGMNPYDALRRKPT